MTQPESCPTPSATRSRAVLALLAALALIAVFASRNLDRLPFDAPLRYDEATHLAEGVEVADALESGDRAVLADYFLSKRVMKGIVYRLWYGVGFTLVTPGTDHGRALGIAACCLALLAIFLLARALAQDGWRNATALLAVAFAVGAPILHEHGRRAMVEPINLMTLALALAAFVHDRKRGTVISAIVAALALLLAVATKYNHALVLLIALGGDALWTAFERRREPWRARLRPFLPFALALLPVVVFLADPKRLNAVAYYIWTIPGGQNPIDFTGALYAKTLLTRFALSVSGSVLLVVLALVGAVVALRTKTPGARLVALHVAIGLALAQSNDLKLERILVPLTGGIFAFGALGTVAILAKLSTIPLRALASVLLAALWIAKPTPSVYALVINPYRQVDQFVDAGLDYTLANPPALWLGGDFGDGVILHSGTVRLRARERGLELPPGAFQFGGVEFFQKSRIDFDGLKSGRVSDEAISRVLRPFRSLVVVLDPNSREPAILEAQVRRVFERIKALGEFEREPKPKVLQFDTADNTSFRTRLEFWRRVPKSP
jgi:4-amino-4-deoxy-L-arabinose transferase-like glycosyltransferase